MKTVQPLDSARRALPQSTNHCFACGSDHPGGLHLCFAQDASQRVYSPWSPGHDFEGFEGVIHGGIVTTVLDEAMSKAVSLQGTRAFTCDLRVRLRQHVRPGERLIVCGWIVEKKKRKVVTEASLTDAKGCERAHAWAVFLEVQQDIASRAHRATAACTSPAASRRTDDG